MCKREKHKYIRVSFGDLNLTFRPNLLMMKDPRKLMLLLGGSYSKLHISTAQDYPTHSPIYLLVGGVLLWQPINRIGGGRGTPTPKALERRAQYQK